MRGEIGSSERSEEAPCGFQLTCVCLPPDVYPPVVGYERPGRLSGASRGAVS